MAIIVVGYDGSEPAKRALDRAAGMADAQIVVVSAAQIEAHGSRGPGPIVDPAEESERSAELDEAVEHLAGKGIVPRTVLGHGDAGAVIVEEAREAGADLVIVGTRGRGAVARTVLGSVSTKVVHDAQCDVLVVR
jgi:nucleotide-binding universal stress UspA family protein